MQVSIFDIEAYDRASAFHKSKMLHRKRGKYHEATKNSTSSAGLNFIIHWRHNKGPRYLMHVKSRK